jgi:D-sedoheptulose 7-phosphate isomerase
MISWRETLQQHAGIIEHLNDLLEVLFDPAVSLLERAVADGKKILICGNGGSAADAQHFAAELVVRYMADRNPIPAIALSSDTSVLTACGNDYGYQHVFARQVQALGQTGDVLVAISTSGGSQNVIEAIMTAKAKGMTTLALSGAKGMVGGCDVDLNVPSVRTDRIQEAHILLIHLLVEHLERRIPQ